MRNDVHLQFDAFDFVFDLRKYLYPTGDHLLRAQRCCIHILHQRLQCLNMCGTIGGQQRNYASYATEAVVVVALLVVLLIKIHCRKQASGEQISDNFEQNDFNSANYFSGGLSISHMCLLRRIPICE